MLKWEKKNNSQYNLYLNSKQIACIAKDMKEKDWFLGYKSYFYRLNSRKITEAKKEVISLIKEKLSKNIEKEKQRIEGYKKSIEYSKKILEEYKEEIEEM